MNAFDLLNANEKRILSQLLKGLTMSEISDINRCTTDEVNNVRIHIISKFEQSSPFKSPETRCFKI